MTATLIIALAALIFVVALLYSTVGHAGASGYLAAMALFSIAPMVMKPTALVPREIIYFSPAAIIGGWIGTLLGTRVLPIAGIRRWLSVVLVLAGGKLLWEAIALLLHR